MRHGDLSLYDVVDVNRLVEGGRAYRELAAESQFVRRAVALVALCVVFVSVFLFLKFGSSRLGDKSADLWNAVV
ncbi:hypothetical protein, partial [Pararobbsia silviterrae]|uniref:hypothetical protein n=1 Tax=Pararobbsia silviterrae TaxID=1792498 RepID=UPI00197E0F85